MYGQNKYGSFTYASGEENEPPQEYYEDLTKLVPPFMSEIAEMKELYTAEGYQVGYAQHVLEDVIKQCYLVTATHGLSRWEKVYGIETNRSLSYEQRREILLAKLRGQGTTTRKMIQNTAAAFSGAEVHVIEDNKNNQFIIRFVGIKGIPRNMQGFIEMLEQIKPAHLAYQFEYRYTVWGELLLYSWDALNNGTWNDVKILKEDT